MSYKFIKSPYWQSRNGKPIDGVVLHTMVGTYDGTIKYFQNNDRQVSAHYCVSLDGDITQMVTEDVGANHAGITSNPKTPVYKGFNPNWNTIGIENADNLHPADADRSKQLAPLAALVRDICLRNNIPIDRDHICGHRELYDRKTCPGNIDVDLVVKLASDKMNPAMPQWLIDLLKEDLGIDTSKSEGEVRGQVGNVKNALNGYESLRKRVETLEEDLINATSQVEGTKTALELESENRMRVETELRDLKTVVDNKDIEIRKLEERVTALIAQQGVSVPVSGNFISNILKWLLRRK